MERVDGERQEQSLIDLSGFHIRPHEKAPVLSNAEDAELIITQLLSEISSGRFQMQEEFVKLIREAGFVSLWFFMKGILAFSGPYDKLNTDLHLEMANFRQSDYCMADGARGALFLPRGHYKSTIGTHGADTWELLRDPSSRILIANSIIDKAKDFFRTVKANFDNNELMRALYPEYVPERSARNWNDDKLVLPNRPRYLPDPNLRTTGVGGASEGGHYDLLDWDDLVGLNDLNSEGSGNMDMLAKKRWAQTAQNSLLDSWKTSRIVLKATRYGIDDVYEMIFSNVKSLSGYPASDIIVQDSGLWNLYLRLAVEDGKVIFPENFTKEKLDGLARDDPWVFQTQYMNSPRDTGLAEFSGFETHDCELVYSEKHEEFFVFPEGREDEAVGLSECDVVMAIDPAGTDKGISAKTSRSAVGVWAKDFRERMYLLWLRTGYYNAVKLFDLIFEGYNVFSGSVRTVCVESNAMQKIIKPLLEKERIERGQYIPIKAVYAGGDKEARIRNNVGRYLMKEKVYLRRGYGIDFIDEKDAFPQSKFRMDVLDMSEKAFTELVTPESPEERNENEEDEEEFIFDETRNPVTGY